MEYWFVTNVKIHDQFLLTRQTTYKYSTKKKHSEINYKSCL